MTAATLALPRLVPPAPTPPARDLPTLAFVRAMRVNGIECWPKAAYEAPILRRKLLGRTRLTVTDPDAVRRVFVDEPGRYVRSPLSIRILRPLLGDGVLIASGADWRHQRRTLSPAFTPKAVQLLVAHILAAIDTATEGLLAESRQGPVDLYARLQRMTLEIAGRSMFSVGMERHGEALRGFVETYAVRLGRPHLLDALLPLGLPSPLDLARARFRKRWTTFLDGVIAERARQRHDGEARDLLDLLGAARDPEGGTAFSPAILRDEVATLMLAGHETTAITLLWACMLLALSPQTQQRVFEEVRADTSDAQDAATLPFTRAVVDETLRLYPPAWIMARVATERDMLAGERVDAGDIVVVAPWLIHRHRKLWDDPDTFDPARFLPGASPPRRFAYLPFGAGPRVCIGAQFALTEAVLALARLVKAFEIGLDGTRPVLPAAIVTLQPDHAPAFRLTPR